MKFGSCKFVAEDARISCVGLCCYQLVQNKLALFLKIGSGKLPNVINFQMLYILDLTPPLPGCLMVHP